MSRGTKVAVLLLCVAVAAIGYVVGLSRGAGEQQLKDQFRVDYAPAQADEFLRRGEIKKALGQLYLAKANERSEGLVDGELGKAYAADKRPCLAQSFLESSIDFMVRERLESLPVYESVKALLAEQRLECAKRRGS